jgi:hypothetical protein
MNAGIVFLTIIIFIVHLMLSAEVGSTAERMNRSFGVWMLMALIISPFIAAICLSTANIGIIFQSTKFSRKNFCRDALFPKFPSLFCPL